MAAKSERERAALREKNARDAEAFENGANPDAAEFIPHRRPAREKLDEADRSRDNAERWEP